MKIPRAELITIAAASAVLVATGSIVMTQGKHVSGLEFAVFELINKLPNTLLIPMLFFTYLAALDILLVMGLVAFALYRKKYILAPLIGATMACLVANAFKLLFSRARPQGLLTEVSMRSQESWSPIGYPSGHSATAAGWLVVLAFIVPGRYKILPIAGIVLVGVSRIYLGMHMPLDVLGGWSIGIIMGVLVKLIIIDKLWFKQPPQTSGV